MSNTEVRELTESELESVSGGECDDFNHLANAMLAWHNLCGLYGVPMQGQHTEVGS